MRVAVLGLGRLGRSLLDLLPAAGVAAQGWRRGEAMPEADVYWLAVREDAIGAVVGLVPPAAVALHASGSLGPEALAPHAERGVLHPLMTFPGPVIGLPSLAGAGASVAGTPRALAAAHALAAALGMVPFEITGDRRAYHAAASLASGHLAAVFLDAAAVLSRSGVPADLAPRFLLPLALESLRRAAAFGPAAITGPVARGDAATQKAHHAVLLPGERELYERIAERILRLRMLEGDGGVE